VSAVRMVLLRIGHDTSLSVRQAALFISTELMNN
jgi:hypothetical protein